MVKSFTKYELQNQGLSYSKNLGKLNDELGYTWMNFPWGINSSLSLTLSNNLLYSLTNSNDYQNQDQMV